jgi:hypothetical protein
MPETTRGRFDETEDEAIPLDRYEGEESTILDAASEVEKLKQRKG